MIDRRPHIAGNAYDHKDAAGMLIHRYGPHIFHTNCAAVFDYLSQFTAWRPYEHRVLAGTVDGQLVPIPINLDTVNRLYGLDLTEERGRGLLRRAAPSRWPRSAPREDVVVSKVGRELYEKFFRGYTRKQWGLDPSRARQVRHGPRADAHQPRRPLLHRHASRPCRRDGYTRMFERMLDHPNITVRLRHRLRARCATAVPHRRLIFTGPVDEYFGFRFGKLPYRSLRFEHDDAGHGMGAAGRHGELSADGGLHARHRVQAPDRAGAPEDEHHLRIPERRRATPTTRSRARRTQALYKRYEALADATPDVWFVGRLATYRYYNMDQVVGQALATFERIQGKAEQRTHAAE